MNWKDIPEYEGLYQVSDCGQVKSCERVVKHYGGGCKIQKERILKPVLNTRGYHQVPLCKDGKVKRFLIHRLVALAFLDGDHSFSINHIDECKTNNHVSNLEYLSNGDNVRAWNKNNPERKAERDRKAQEACGQQVIDNQTSKTFSSIREASRYMYEEEGAKGLYVWDNKIRKGQQNRFQLINN